MNRLLIAFFGCAVAFPAVAQDIYVPPVTTGSAGYLFPNSASDLDRYRTNDDNTQDRSASEPKETSTELECDVSQIPDEYVAELQEGFEIRKVSSGERDAKKWLDDQIQTHFQRLNEQGHCS